MNGEMKSFLQEGVWLYTEAQNTLGAFEREIGKLLKATLETRKRWAPLKHYDIGMPSAGGGQYGWWVAVGITGQSSRREEAEVECGLWWNAPPIEEPIIYAGFYKGPKRVQKLLWHRGKQGILSFERWGRTFLYVPVPKSVEIEAPLNRLLDGVLKRLV